MNRFKESELSLDDHKTMELQKIIDIFYPPDNMRHKDITMPDDGHGKRADLGFLWLEYKKAQPDGYQQTGFQRNETLMSTIKIYNTSTRLSRITYIAYFLIYTLSITIIIVDTLPYKSFESVCFLSTEKIQNIRNKYVAVEFSVYDTGEAFYSEAKIRVSANDIYFFEAGYISKHWKPP